MIDKKTLFILGAGASMPYGLPSASELRIDIINNTREKYKKILLEGKQPGTVEYNSEMEKVKELEQKFRDSGITSIDYFLMRNVRLMDVGKKAIALSIFNKENPECFNERANDQKSDWYKYLFNYMISDLRTSESYNNYQDNNIVFITFNYDRSLEKYLYTSLLNSFELAGSIEIKKQILTRKIFHVYGSLGDLPELVEPDQTIFFKYGEEMRNDYLDIVKNKIDLISTDINRDVYQGAISEAEIIFLLGFGFDEENLKNISFYNSIQPYQNIYATTIGLKPRRISEIKNKIKKSIGVKIEEPAVKSDYLNESDKYLIFENCNCLELLEMYL